MLILINFMTVIYVVSCLLVIMSTSEWHAVHVIDNTDSLYLEDKHC